MARRESVTVSIADETIGMLSRIVEVRRVVTSTSVGMTAERRGIRRTSSNVMPSPTILPVDSSSVRNSETIEREGVPVKRGAGGG
jgi:hypothetical protein